MKDNDAHLSLAPSISEDTIIQAAPVLLQVLDAVARPLDSLACSLPVSHIENLDLIRLTDVAAKYMLSASYRQSFTDHAQLMRAEISADDAKAAIVLDKYRSLDLEEKNAKPGEKIRISDVASDIEHLLALTANAKCTSELRVTPRRTNHIEADISNDDLIFQCDTAQLAHLLGLGETDIGKLVRSGLITPLRHLRTTRDMLYDLRGIESSLKFPRSPEHGSTIISFRDIVDTRYMELFGASLADLIVAANSGEVPAYCAKNSQNYSGLAFDRDSLIGYFDARLLRIEKDFTAKEVSLILAVNLDSVQDLVTSGQLYTNHWHNPTNFRDVMVKSCSLSEFLASKFCLNRLSKLFSIRIDKVVKCFEGNGNSVASKAEKGLVVANQLSNGADSLYAYRNYLT
ncbi:hypothetical protein [Halioglobus japonicus]|nr:hypothetical protein [Halioglobus japonicus]